MAVLAVGVAARVPLVAASTAALATALVAWAADLHRERLVMRLADDLPGVLVAAGAAGLVLSALDAGSVLLAGPVTVSVAIGHRAVYAVVGLRRRSGGLRRSVLVVGTGPTSRRLAETLLLHPGLGLEPAGFVSAAGAPRLAEARGLPRALVGGVADLPRAMSETGVDAVLVALDGPPRSVLPAALDGLLSSGAEVYAVPAWLPPSHAHVRTPGEVVAGVPVVHLHRGPAPGPLRWLRRTVELLAAAATLAALVPVAALIALPVWLETGGLLVRHHDPDAPGATGTTRFRTRRARSLGRPGTTFTVSVAGRLRFVGRVLQLSHLDALPELLLTQLRHLTYAAGLPPGLRVGPATSAHRHETEVHVGQLAR